MNSQRKSYKDHARLPCRKKRCRQESLA